MGLQVVGGISMVMCSAGIAPMPLNVLPLNMVITFSMATATIKDMVPFLNVLPFAMCTSLANPLVATATSCAFGVLTPMPCTPLITGPWIPGTPTTMIQNTPCVDQSCKAICAFGGCVSVLNPGQMTTILG